VAATVTTPPAPPPDYANFLAWFEAVFGVDAPPPVGVASDGKPDFSRVKPAIDDFKNYSVFMRAFPFDATNPNATPPDYVTDGDIATAFQQVPASFNKKLFSGSNNDARTAFLWNAAAWLVIDFKAAAQGVAGSTSGIIAARAVGSVSESYVAPPRFVQESPTFMELWSNPFGQKYLSIIALLLIGNVAAIQGTTWP
jgi:hypothetical protein